MSENESSGPEQPDATPEAPREQLLGARLLAEITDRLVLLIREHYGRGPIKAKTYVIET